MKQMVIWLSFALFVAVSWLWLAWYFYLIGGQPCEISGDCLQQRIVSIVALLLIPFQVLIFVVNRNLR